MKRIFMTTILIVTLAIPILAFAQQATTAAATEATAAPTGDVAQDIGAVVDAVRSGSAIAIAAAVIMLLINLFKSPALGSVVNKIPKRWRVAVPVILGGVAAILSNVMGGIPWAEALMVGLFSGPTAVFAHEAVVEAILGRAKTRG